MERLYGRSFFKGSIMANQIYDSWLKYLIGEGGYPNIVWKSEIDNEESIQAVLVGQGYRFDSRHETLADVRRNISGFISNSAVLNTRQFFADDLGFASATFPFVEAGQTVKAILIFYVTEFNEEEFSGVDVPPPKSFQEENTKMMMYIDTINDLPFITSGGQITIRGL